MPYDEETKRLIEDRKKKSEEKKEKQMKKRKAAIAGSGVIVALLVVVIVIAASCSAKKDATPDTSVKKETTIIGGVTETRTEAVTTKVTAKADSQTQTGAGETTQAESTTEVETTTVATETVKTGTKRYTTDMLNLRKEANKDSEVVDQIDPGEQVEVIAVAGEWTNIKYNGNTGYVLSEYLSNKNKFD